MEVGFVVAFKLFLGLAGINTLQNAETTEVLQRHLHVPDCIRSRFVLGGLALYSCLDLSHL